MRADQIALQLYSVRDETASDMLGTLRKLADMGFRAVELAGYGNSSAQEVRAALDDLGMRAMAAHVGMDKFETSASQTFDELKMLGVDYAVVPSIPRDRRADVAGARRIGEQFNSLAEQARAVGMGFAYHNHDFEFAPLDGTDFYETLLGSTDPDLVKLELDVYWALFAGRDPVDLIKRNAGRVSLLHVKDMVQGEDRDMAVPGEGILDWRQVLDIADAAGTEWYIIEHDRPTDPLNDVERGLRYLEGLAR
jgi:sugar phosphate isomerase/epimerase